MTKYQVRFGDGSIVNNLILNSPPSRLDYLLHNRQHYVISEIVHLSNGSQAATILYVDSVVVPSRLRS